MKTNNLHSENKGADQLCRLRSAVQTAQLISAFVLATGIVQSLFFLNLKFQTSSLLLRLHRLVLSDLVGIPNCWFSHAAAHHAEIRQVLRTV